MSRQDRRWLMILGVGLVVSSAALYAIHFAIFRDSHHIFIYMLGDLSFVPLEILIVGLIVDRLISMREKRALHHKLNMVIGAFFSELGTSLIAELMPTMCAVPEIKERLHVNASWSKDDFLHAFRFAHTIDCEVDLERVDLEAIKADLGSHRHFVLRLLENPNLMEHERFTNLLWAVLHLQEELEARTTLDDLVPADEAHLQVDFRRAFNQLLAEWVLYVRHLKDDYPYLFSLVLRMHPFQDAPSPTISG